MDDILKFSDRAAFRAWLAENVASRDGVWLLFGKKGGPDTLSATEALEEALCFGWIDGQMQSLDDKSYKKYFALRRSNSKWSEKNKTLAARLEQQGKMTEHGRRKIEEAKANGQWSAAKPPDVGEEEISLLAAVLREHELACKNFAAMPPSVKKTYARAFMDPKTEAGKEKRLAWIIDRLNNNLKPM